MVNPLRMFLFFSLLLGAVWAGFRPQSQLEILARKTTPKAATHNEVQVRDSTTSEQMKPAKVRKQYSKYIGLYRKWYYVAVVATALLLAGLMVYCVVQV